ncbi:hypothetical protein HDE_11659 [Halotydeus destructor]|nr:hypothetical protein HDE_11659 [Halotydeus destructor]
MLEDKNEPTAHSLASLRSDKPTNAVYEVLHYHVLLEEILSNLNELDLKSCQDVSSNFSYISKQLVAKRRTIQNMVYPFRLLRFEDERKDSLVSPAAYKWFHRIKPSIDIGTDNIENTFVENIKLSFAKPDIILLIEGSNTKVGKRRRWKRAKIINAIRSKLPPTCRVIGIDAHYGLIGCSTSSKETNDPLAYSFDLMNVFSTSCCFIPKFENVDIEIFNRTTELTSSPDIKAMVLFSSGLTHTGQYIELANVAQVFSDLAGNFAIAGAQINDRLTTHLVDIHYSDDTANFYFVNGRPPYNPMYNPQKLSLIGLLFRGENVKAASLVIESNDHLINGNQDEVICCDELDNFHSQLTRFKANLDFDVEDTSGKSETVAFVFVNNAKFKSYCQDAEAISPGLDAIKKSFPSAKLIGLLTHAQYEHNYWSHIERKEEPSVPSTPSSNSVASLILINIRKI